MDEDEDYTCDLTEEELFELTEGLLDNDENNCAKYFRYNFQGNLFRGVDNYFGAARYAVQVHQKALDNSFGNNFN